MVTTMGALGMLATGCGTCTAAEPPPPYVPKYTAEDAAVQFRKHPCARALGDAQMASAGLRGFQSPEGPAIVLDLDVLLAPSGLGVRYRATASLMLDPVSGAVRDGAACTEQLHALVDAMNRAVVAAEASPEVRRFIADHGPAGQIQATFEAHVQPRGRIVLVAPGPDGARVPLVWE